MVLFRGRNLEFIKGNNMTDSFFILSKLANVDSNKSTLYLSNIMHNYKMSFNDSSFVIDKIAFVDNNASITMKEILIALNQSSHVAKSIGLPFDNLLAYIGAIISATRMDSEDVGKNLSIIFERMRIIDSGVLENEDFNIRSFEESMLLIGISIKNADFSNKKMIDILEEIANKWDRIDYFKKVEIVKLIAGIKQYPILIILLDNWFFVETLLEGEKKCFGLANKNYDIILKNGG